jgi:hypothetical protein
MTLGLGEDLVRTRVDFALFLLFFAIVSLDGQRQKPRSDRASFLIRCVGKGEDLVRTWLRFA